MRTSTRAVLEGVRVALDEVADNFRIVGEDSFSGEEVAEVLERVSARFTEELVERDEKAAA